MKALTYISLALSILFISCEKEQFISNQGSTNDVQDHEKSVLPAIMFDKTPQECMEDYWDAITSQSGTVTDPFGDLMDCLGVSGFDPGSGSNTPDEVEAWDPPPFQLVPPTQSNVDITNSLLWILNINSNSSQSELDNAHATLQWMNELICDIKSNSSSNISNDDLKDLVLQYMISNNYTVNQIQLMSYYLTLIFSPGAYIDSQWANNILWAEAGTPAIRSYLNNSLIDCIGINVLVGFPFP